MALGSTQPLVKMSTRNIPEVKGGRCVRLTTSPPSCAECYEIWNPLGHTGPVTGLLYLINIQAFVICRGQSSIGTYVCPSILVFPYYYLSTNAHLFCLSIILVVCLFVFLALQPIVVVFSQPGSGL